MKKTLSKILLILVASFLFGAKAFATTDQTYSQIDFPFSYSINLCQSAGGTGAPYYCDSASIGEPYQEFTPTVSGYIHSITVVAPTSSYNYSKSYMKVLNSSGVQLTAYYTSTTLNSTSTTNLIFTPQSPASTTPLYVTAGTKYRFKEMCDPTYCGTPNYKAHSWKAQTPSTTYPGYDAVLQSGTKVDKDAWVQWTINDYSSNAEVYFDSTPTSTCDFQNWSVWTNLDTATYDYCKTNNCSVRVQFGNAGHSFLPYENTIINLASVWYDLSGMTSGGLLENLLPKPMILRPGYVVSARAIIYKNSTDYSIFDSNIVTASDFWDFIILPDEYCSSTTSTNPLVIPGYVGVTAPTATSTNWGDNITCDPNDSFFTKGMCNLFLYLFQPNPAVLDSWSQLKGRIEKKPPFGYITQYVSTTMSLTTTTATSSVSMSYLQNINFLQTIRALFVWILWLLFGIWVILRLKGLSLHG